MSNTLNLGNGNWGVKKDSLLGYNSENGNFKPLPFDFTRASSATVVNKAGLIETVGSGEPRIDFSNDAKGALLLEPTRSNNLLQSNQFDTTWTLSSSISLTSEQSGVGGSIDAWLLKKTDASSRYINQTIILSSSTYSYSIFAKKESGNWLYVRLADSGGSLASTSYFDLENGVVGSTSANSLSIQSYNNGWYRCEVNFTHSIGSVRMYPAVSDGSPSGGSGGEGVYIYGAQLESNSSYATSYIPTQGSVVTRVQETSATPSNNINNFGTSNFSLFIESYIKEGYNARLKKMNTWTSRGYGFYVNAYGLRGRVYGDSQIDTNYVGIGSVINNSKNKALMVVDRVLNTITIYSNGVNVHSQSIASIAGDSLDNTSSLELQRAINIEAGFINDFKIYNTSLTNAEAIALTSN